jgi:hypothetical protein
MTVLFRDAGLGTFDLLSLLHIPNAIAEVHRERCDTDAEADRGGVAMGEIRPTSRTMMLLRSVRDPPSREAPEPRACLASLVI